MRADANTGAGVVGMAMADGRVPRSGLRLPGAWTVPLGAALTTLGHNADALDYATASDASRTT